MTSPQPQKIDRRRDARSTPISHSRLFFLTAPKVFPPPPATTQLHFQIFGKPFLDLHDLQSKKSPDAPPAGKSIFL
jgi:hypothetical protein